MTESLEHKKKERRVASPIVLGNLRPGFYVTGLVE